MSNILKIVDLTDHAIRCAVFAVIDGFAASIAPTAKEPTACLRAVPAWACRRVRRNAP